MLQFIATYHRDHKLIDAVIGIENCLSFFCLPYHYESSVFIDRTSILIWIFSFSHFVGQIIVRRRQLDAIRQQQIVYCRGRRRHHRIWQPTVMPTSIRSAMAIQIPWPWWMAIASFNILDWYALFVATPARANTMVFWPAMGAPGFLSAAFDENWFIGECSFLSSFLVFDLNCVWEILTLQVKNVWGEELR